VRGNALGTFQASVGLWQILARQGELPPAQLYVSWQGVLSTSEKVRSSGQVFDAGVSSVGELFRAATGKQHVSQDELIELIAGPRQSLSEGTPLPEACA